VTARRPAPHLRATRTATGQTAHPFSEKPTWRLSIDHHLTDQVMFMRANRGFRSGALYQTLIGAGTP